MNFNKSFHINRYEENLSGHSGQSNTRENKFNSWYRKFYPNGKETLVWVWYNENIWIRHCLQKNQVFYYLLYFSNQKYRTHWIKSFIISSRKSEFTKNFTTSFVIERKKLHSFRNNILLNTWFAFLLLLHFLRSHNFMTVSKCLNIFMEVFYVLKWKK